MFSFFSGRGAEELGLFSTSCVTGAGFTGASVGENSFPHKTQ